MPKGACREISNPIPRFWGRERLAFVGEGQSKTPLKVRENPSL